MNAGSTYTRQELDTFRVRLDEYGRIRNAILALWKAEHGSYLSFDRCVTGCKQELEAAGGSAPADHAVAHVFNFLNRNGYINWGLPRDHDVFHVPANLRPEPGKPPSAGVVAAATIKTLMFADKEVRRAHVCLGALRAVGRGCCCTGSADPCSIPPALRHFPCLNARMIVRSK